ncbi:hypothetical protein ACFWWM_08000 [Streptomyces sp. NPDC058682]|uniref:hypothetical protein n=1 Tax=Streptomyces sp. NPDC058682 TaxID=3346596 RepID=UPI00364F6D79
MPLTRSDMVDVSVALDLAGTKFHASAVGGATVVVGTMATVIIAHVVDDPAASGVWNDQEFRLHGPTPDLAASRLTEPAPFTTTGPAPFTTTGPERGHPVHLFVRIDELCTYLGLVRHSQSKWADGELYSCHLRIDPPLSRELLDKVRPPGTQPALPGLGWLDHVETEPGRALELFVTSWYPNKAEPRPAAAIPGSVPPALAGFYRLAEKHPAILGGQNFLAPPAELTTDERAERLIFGTENQGGWEWSIPWDLDAADTDPEVWLTEEDEPVPEQEPLSGFLLQFSLYEASMTAPYKAFARALPRQLLPRLESCLHRVPLRPFLSPISPKDFLVGPGVIAHVSPGWHDEDEDEVDVWIGAHHRSALRPLGEVDIRWSRFDG